MAGQAPNVSFIVIALVCVMRRMTMTASARYQYRSCVTATTPGMTCYRALATHACHSFCSIGQSKHLQGRQSLPDATAVIIVTVRLKHSQHQREEAIPHACMSAIPDTPLSVFSVPCVGWDFSMTFRGLTLEYSCDDGDDEYEHAQHHENHARPPALPGRVDDAHALDTLLMAAGNDWRAQIKILHGRLVAAIL